MPEATPFTPELARRLADASSVAALTGAGISAESGVPTFREPGGLWQRFKPEELANVRAFLDNPQLVQNWYEHRRRVVTETSPNPGHYALAEFERLIPDFTLITQNVDDLHRRAGSKNVVELHGNVTRSYCIKCRKPAAEEDMTPLAEGEPARCSRCGGFIRPDVVWFGEMLPVEAIEKADETTRKAEVFLTIGTSAQVYPAAGLPIQALANGAYVAEINVQPSAIADQVHEVVLGKSGEVLPALVEAVRALRGG